MNLDALWAIYNLVSQVANTLAAPIATAASGSILFEWIAKPAMQGFVGNRADWYSCLGLTKLRNYLRDTDPPLNHELQIAGRRAYLNATLELVQQAQSTPAPGAPASDRDALRAIAKLIQQEIGGLGEKNPPQTTIANLDLLVAESSPDNSAAVQRRIQAFKDGMEQSLTADIERWRPGASRFAALRICRVEGWTLNGFRREWHGAMAIHFMEIIKGNDEGSKRVRAVFQSQLLATIVQREPAFPQTFDEFASRFDTILASLAEIKEDIRQTPARVADELIRRSLFNPAAPHHAFGNTEEPANFTGRGDLLDWLESELTAHAHTCLLHGQPGAGKSLTAAEFAYRHKARFDAVIVLPCGNVPLEQITSQLPDRIPAVDPQMQHAARLAAARHWLSTRRSLLVLDDVWHDDVQALLPGGNASVLITSRRPSTFGLLPAQRREVPGWPPADAEAYLRAQIPEWMDVCAPQLLDFAKRVEYLPYAIAIAAGLLPLSSDPMPDAIRALTIHSLQHGKLNLPALHHQALAAQSEDAQTLLRAFAACLPQGAALFFATQVSGFDPTRSAAALRNTLDASLLRILDRNAQTFSLHATLHELLSGEPESGGLRTRHRQILTSLFAKWKQDRFTALPLVPEALRALVHTEWTDDDHALAYDAYDCASDMAKLPEAMTFLQQDALRSVGNKSRLQAIWGNQALILKDWGRPDEAMDLRKKEEAIGEELADRAGLSRCWGNQALILKDWGRLDEAMELYKKQEAVCAELGDRAGLQASWGNQALILKAWGRLDEAMELLKKKEAVCAELGDRAGLSRCWGNQALILQDWGRLDEAMELHKKEETVCAELGDRAGLQTSWGNQAVILQAWGRLDEAMELHKKKETVCAELGNRAGLQASWGNQALILQDWGRLDEAMELCKKQEAVCAELGDRAGLQRSWGNQAVILQDWGRLDEAMELHNKQEAVCAELGDRLGKAQSLGNQSLIHETRNQIPKARAKITQALAIFTDLRMPRERDQAQRILDRLNQNHPPPTSST